MALVTHKELGGHLANWAIRQHPYGRPEGLFDLVDCITNAAQTWEIGPPSLKMMEVDGSGPIEKWLRATLVGHPILLAWNTARSGRPDGLTSRYGGPKPENDFIDIDALLRNVAMSAWQEAHQASDDSSKPLSTRGIDHGAS
jgi:hypothetical protein